MNVCMGISAVMRTRLRVSITALQQVVGPGGKLKREAIQKPLCN